MGKQVQDFILQEEIGSGAFGKVYKATNIRTHQVVAIKIIPKQLFKTTPKLEECLQNQIKVLGLVSRSPHIINHIKAFKSQHNIYMVYQYCNGGTLYELLKKRNCLSEDEALRIIQQLVEAFRELNSHHILHRDLKPENIFFHNEQLKLGDFGFSKTLQPGDPVAMTMIGSPIYMAPQVIKGQAYTSKADIWSLGVILYQMLYGECPFQSNSIAGLILSLHNEHLKFPRISSFVSQQTIELMTKMLDKDEFKRIAWEDLFQHFSDHKQTVISSHSGMSNLLRPLSNRIPSWQRYSVTSLLKYQHNASSRGKYKHSKTVQSSRTDSTINGSKGSFEDQLNLSGRFQVNRLLNNYGKQLISKMEDSTDSTGFGLYDVEKSHTKAIEAANLAVDIFIDDQRQGSLYYYLILAKVLASLSDILKKLSPFNRAIGIISIVECELTLLKRELEVVKDHLSLKGVMVQNILDVPTFLGMKENCSERKTELWWRMCNYFKNVGAPYLDKPYSSTISYKNKYIDSLF